MPSASYGRRKFNRPPCNASQVAKETEVKTEVMMQTAAKVIKSEAIQKAPTQDVLTGAEEEPTFVKKGELKSEVPTAAQTSAGVPGKADVKAEVVAKEEPFFGILVKQEPVEE